MARDPTSRGAPDGSGYPGLEPLLREGRGIVRELTAAVAGMAGAGAGAARRSAIALSHRLYGSTSLYGLDALASLAAAVHDTVSAWDAGAGGIDPRLERALADAVEGLEAALAAAAGPGEAATDLPALTRRLEELGPGPGPEDGAVADDEAGADPVGARLATFAGAEGEVLEFFVPEAREQTEGMAQALSKLFADAGDRGPVEVLGRFVHTLKGAAFMVGCDPIGQVTHAMEGVLGPLRDGRLEPGGPALDAVEEAIDLLERMIAVLEGKDVPITPVFERVVARLAELAPEDVEHPGRPASEAADDAASEPAAFTSPPRRAPAVAAPRAGEPSIRVALGRIDELMRMVDEAVILRGRLERRLAQLDRLAGQFTVSRDRLADAAARLERDHLAPRVGEPRDEAWASPLGRPESLGLEDFSELELDRYDELDILSRQIAEIGFDLGQSCGELGGLSRGLSGEVDDSAKLFRSLRSAIGRARMQPLAPLFERFRRQVDRIGRESGKRVRLEIAGGEVEVDTAVVERIADPLLHLVSNAMVHGVEHPEQRLEVGKPEQARVALRAYVQGPWVHLEIEDDGRGLRADELRRRAVELGLLGAEEAARLSEREALELMFLPGVSTAEQVTETAGRGIGMDVVRSAVAGLNGRIGIESIAGLGTRLTLSLPVTLVISSALRVRVGSQRLALPVLNVQRLLRLSADEVRREEGRELVAVGNATVELVRLDRALGIAAQPPGDSLSLVLVQVVERTFALAVDELLGIEDVVVQGLGSFLAGLACFSGVTVDPQGEVILVLDPAGLWDAGRDLSRPSLAAAAEIRPPAVGADRPAVLLADDSISVRRVVGAKLAAAGYEVVAVHDGQQALDALRERSFDALVTDLEMPRLNGFELIDAVRRRPGTRDLPVIVITTRAGRKHRELAAGLGVTGYFAKPIDFEPLLDTLAGATAPGRPPTAPGDHSAAGAARFGGDR